MDDLIKICDDLENCKKKKICYKNEVICTKNVLKGYIGDDRNKLLKLKAELEIYKNFENSILNDLSFLVSFITLIVTMIYNASVGTESAIRTATAYSSFILVVLLAVLTVIQIFHKTISSRSKWRKYIAIVIEDIEKEK